MKRLLILVLLFLLTGVSINADPIRAPKGFAGKMYSGALALYGQLGEDLNFLCTTEPYQKTPDGYNLVTAGHCIQTNPIAVKYFVSEYIGGPRVPVTIEKAYLDQGTDFAILRLQTKKVYPIFNLGDENELRVGDKVLDLNFTEGLVKQLSLGTVASDIMPISAICEISTCAGDFIVHINAGPGASGSAVISARTHRVVGILKGEFRGQVGYSVEPISRFQKFLVGPNQPHPADEGQQ